MKRLTAGAAVMVLFAAMMTFGSPASPAAAVTAHVPAHYVANQGPNTTDQNAALAVGYNWQDFASNSVMNASPAGVQGVRWVGNGYNTTCSWAVSDATLTTVVQQNIGNPKFSGVYFISDEPHSLTCPGGPAALAQRTALIHSLDPTAKTFATIQYNANTNEYANFANAVDYEGPDPYPCNQNNLTSCDFTTMASKIDTAVAAVGASRIVPVFQLFGQTCNTGSHFYRLPTSSELTTLLATWDARVPSWLRPFDMSYGWNNQSSACPTLKDANGTNGYPDHQTAMHNYFAAMTPVTVTTGPAADTYVASESPTSGFGTQTTMCASFDGVNTSNTLLRFAVAGVGARTVLSADLAVHVYNGSANTPSVYRVGDQTWPESVTWNAAPAADPTALTTMPATTVGQTVHIDLGGLITADGTYSVEIRNNSSDSMCLDTREGAVPPVLTVVAQH